MTMQSNSQPLSQSPNQVNSNSSLLDQLDKIDETMRKIEERLARVEETLDRLHSKMIDSNRFRSDISFHMPAR